MADDELGTLRAELADARAQAAQLEAQRRDLERALRESEMRLAATQRQGQLEGIALSARTLAHLLNNDLALPIGVIELLQQHPGVPPSLRDVVRDAVEGLRAAVAHVAALQQVVRVETLATPAGPALDLERSIDPAPTASPPDPAPPTA